MCHSFESFKKFKLLFLNEFILFYVFVWKITTIKCYKLCMINTNKNSLKSLHTIECIRKNILWGDFQNHKS